MTDTTDALRKARETFKGIVAALTVGGDGEARLACSLAQGGLRATAEALAAPSSSPSAPTAEMLTRDAVRAINHLLNSHSYKDATIAIKAVEALAALARSEPPTTEARLTELRTETTAFVAKMKDGTLSAKDFSPEELALAREVLGRSEPPTGEPVAISDESLNHAIWCVLKWAGGSISSARWYGCLSEVRALLAEARSPGAVPEPWGAKMGRLELASEGDPTLGAGAHLAAPPIEAQAGESEPITPAPELMQAVHKVISARKAIDSWNWGSALDDALVELGLAYEGHFNTSRPRCPSCGTPEVSMQLTCHNSSCAKYAHEVTVYEGWKRTGE